MNKQTDGHFEVKSSITTENDIKNSQEQRTYPIHNVASLKSVGLGRIPDIRLISDAGYPVSSRISSFRSDIWPTQDNRIAGCTA